MRHVDWPKRLFNVIKVAKNSDFEWGKHDCALFTCDCIKAIIGIDYAAEFRGKYETKTGAVQALQSIESVKDLPELADKYLGERVGLTRARRGDIVSLTIDSMEALGVVVGSHAVFLTIDGIQTIPLQECAFAWEVN